jgi:hypothetical protein
LHWKLKAAAFRLLELSPFGEKLHFLAQRHLTRSWPRPRRILASLVNSTSETLRIFSTHSDISLAKARFLEIGAGRDLCLRHSEYLAMHRRAGLEIIHTETYSEDVPSFVADNLAGRFGGFETHDLKILHSRIISRRILNISSGSCICGA